MNIVAWNIVDAFEIGSALQVTESSESLIYPSSLFFFWLIAGILLLIAEYLIQQQPGKRYQYIALSMAIPAWIVALGLLLNRVGVDFNLQVLSWMGMSVIAALWGRSILLSSNPESNDRS